MDSSELWKLDPSELCKLDPSEICKQAPSELCKLDPSELCMQAPSELCKLDPSELWIRVNYVSSLCVRPPSLTIHHWNGRHQTIQYPPECDGSAENININLQQDAHVISLPVGLSLMQTIFRCGKKVYRGWTPADIKNYYLVGEEAEEWSRRTG